MNTALIKTHSRLLSKHQSSEIIKSSIKERKSIINELKTAKMQLTEQTEYSAFAIKNTQTSANQRISYKRCQFVMFTIRKIKNTVL